MRMCYSSWSIGHSYLFDQIFNFYCSFVVYSGYSQMTSVHISMLDERWTIYSYTAKQNRCTVMQLLYCFLVNQVPAWLWILICFWIFINNAMSQQWCFILILGLLCAIWSLLQYLSRVFWCCWSGDRKVIWLVKELLQEFTFRVFSK